MECWPICRNNTFKNNQIDKDACNGITIITLKFADCYEKWRNIGSKYQLEWSNDYSLDTFKNIILDEH